MTWEPYAILNVIANRFKVKLTRYYSIVCYVEVLLVNNSNNIYEFLKDKLTVYHISLFYVLVLSVVV